MTRSYTIRIGSDDTNSSDFIVEIDDYQNIDINQNPTSFGDFSATIPYTPNIEDEILEEVYIIDDTTEVGEDEVLFAGILETTSSDGTGNAQTTIGGRGIFVKEDYDSRTYQVSNAFLRDEIQNFAANYIGFDTTFTTASETSDTPFSEDGSNLGDDVTNTGPNSPVTAGASSIYVADVGALTDFTQSMYDAATKSGTTAVVNNSNYSQGSGVRFGEASGTHTLEFDIGQFEYEVPTNYDIPVRLQESGTVDEIRVYVNGTLETAFNVTSAGHNWQTQFGTSAAIPANSSTTVRIEVDTSDATSYVDLDCLSLHDGRYSYNTPDTLNDNDVYYGPEQTPVDIGIEFAEKGAQASTKASANFEVDGYPDTNENLSNFRADFNGNLQSGGTETVTDTYTVDEDTSFAAFDVTFSEDANGVQVTFDAIVQPDYESRVSGESGRTNLMEILQATIVPFESETLTFIESKEYSGSDAEIYKQLHNDSVYDFSVDYRGTGNTVIDTFPQGQKVAFEGVRTEDYTRDLDYSEYANQVTVKTKDANGNTLTATKKNSAEVDRVGQIVHRQFTEPSLNTQTEVTFAAANKLDSLVLEGDQSGSIKAVPSRVQPGYNYAFSAFNDKFTNGGTIGDAGLLLDASQNEWLLADNYPNTENPTDLQFEFLIWPEIRDLADNEYYTAFGSPHGIEGDVIRVYGDGSLEVCQPAENGAPSFVRTDGGLLLDENVHRVTIDMNTNTGEGGIYVDGGTAGSPDEPLDFTVNPNFGHMSIGASTAVSSGSISTTSDVWYRFDCYDTFASQAFTYSSDYANGDTIVDVRGNHAASVDDAAASDDFRYTANTVSGGGAIIEAGAALEPDDGHSTTFPIGTGDISVATWIEGVPSSTADSQIFDKFDNTAGEGHELYIEADTGYAVYRVGNGTSTQTLKGDTSLYNGAHHVGVTLDNDGEVKLWVDGEIAQSAAYAFSGEDVGTTSPIKIGNDAPENKALDGTIADFAWFEAVVPDVEMEALATYTPFSNNYQGGLDDVRVWEGADLQKLLDNPYREYQNSVFESERSDHAQTLWTFDAFNSSDEATNTYGIDFWDEAGHGDGTSLFAFGGTLHSPNRGTLKEVSISLGRGSADMSLNLNLSRRVDANLSQAIQDIDEVRKLL